MLDAQSLMEGSRDLIHVADKVSGAGRMTTTYISTALGARVLMKSNQQGTTYTGKGKGWGFSIEAGRGRVDILNLYGDPMEIEQVLMLARIAR